MSLTLRTTLMVLGLIFVIDQSEASVANLMADRVLGKLSSWIETDGSNWMTLPGHFQQGQVHQIDNKFTVALGGPKLTALGKIVRSGDAVLEDAQPDDVYKSHQKLRFTVQLMNVNVTYENVTYIEDEFGSFNFKPIASTDSITVQVTLDLKGDLESCMAFPDDINVNSQGAISITVGDKIIDQKIPAVIGAVSSHFKSTAGTNIETLLESGTLITLQDYDVCNDANNPIIPARILGEQILHYVVQGLRKEVSTWAWLPGFWEQFHAPNGTVTNFLRVGVGNFTTAGNVQRIEDASYSNNEDLQAITMKWETHSMTGFYENVYFTDNVKQYYLSASVTTQSLSASVSVQFLKLPSSRIPSCNGDTVKVDVKYGGGELTSTLQPTLPKHLSDIVIPTVKEGFRRSLKEAATDLFQAAAVHAFSIACPSKTTNSWHVRRPNVSFELNGYH